jgi:osmotically inducible protein OsmC
MATTRSAETTWTGSLIEGSGHVTLASSGVGTFPVTWASRAEAPEGRTSPEELIAAAHSSCFSMAFSSALAKAGATSVTLHTGVEVDFQPGQGITAIRIVVSGSYEGIDRETFVELAEGAKANCPVSKALAAVPISLSVN